MQPVPYPVTTPYGVPGSWAAGVHTGSDYACPEGTPVVAATGGQVLLAETQGDYGLRVDVQAEGRQHSYSHLSRIEVWPGQHIQAGQRIGLSGNTGRSTGPHLHYEERVPHYGYYDHAAPIYPGQAVDDDQQPDDTTDEEAPMFVFFQHKGGIWLGDGMHRRTFPNPQALADAKHVIEASGYKYSEWPGEVQNPNAFGHPIG